MFEIGGKTYESYEEYIKETVDHFYGYFPDIVASLDRRIDFLNETTLRLEALIKAIPSVVVPPPPEELPPFPRDLPTLLADLILVDIALDMRRFLIMLYRLGRAYEVRLSSYLEEIPAGKTDGYTYTIPNTYVYIPHVESVNLGIQRILTRYDYEMGNIQHTERHATDRTVEWGMTPLSRIISGSFGVSFDNVGTVDTWVKSRFTGTLMRESDFLWWRRTVRKLSDKYMGYMA